MKNLLLALFLVFLGTSLGKAKGTCPIVPTPQMYSEYKGTLQLSNSLKVIQGKVSNECMEYLKMHLKKRNITIEFVEKNPDLEFQLLKDDLGNGYEIEIDQHSVISFQTMEGAFYAVNSYLQLIQSEENNRWIQRCKIEDQPKFEWRGLHLDVSRHFFSVEEIKGFIDIMALYKFNKFHWHLTDDQGWRIEIKKYPKLTEIGAFRDSTVVGHFSDSPRKYDTGRYGGFYSQEDVKEVVAYAQSKFIDVVPEIEMPGHSRAALAAYPEYSCTGELQPVPGLWGIFDDIYCSKSESIDFMKDILGEVLDLFPSEYIHIGGDEAPKVRWKECDDCQKVIKENDLHDEHELQSYFIRQIDAYLTAEGRKLIGWDEILEGGLSPNAAVMSWRGEAGGIEAAKQGHYVVMSPTTYCYFDYYQSSHDIEPLAIGGYLPLEKVYKYDPIPEEIPAEYKKYVLGGQANLWTEYMGSMDHVEYMAFPRALALIQSLWCTKKPEYDEFLQTYLNHHESYLELNGVNFAKSIHYPELIINRVEEGIEIQFKNIESNEKYGILRTSSKLVDNAILGSVFDASAKESHVIVAGNKLIMEDFKLTSKSFEDTVRYHFNVTEDLGRNIDLVTPPHPKYDHNGSLNLVDGITAGATFKGSEWLGFRENKIKMIVDVKDVEALEGLIIGFKDNNGSWIYLPTHVIIYTSDDRLNWEKAGSATKFKDGENSIPFASIKSNYVKIVIGSLDEIPAGKGGAGNAPWTFIDEIQFIRK